MPAIAPTLNEALAAITDGCVLAVPRESTGAAMAATRALIRRGVRRLTLIALPTSSLQADLLIGAGCVETLETSAVSMGEFGAAPRFTAAVLKGSIDLPSEDEGVILRVLTRGRAAEALSYLPIEHQEELVRSLSSDQINSCDNAS